MRIAILGATGRVGKRVLHKALRDGHDVTVLVRNPDKLVELRPERLTVLHGDVRRPEDIRRSLQQAELLISCLSTDGGTVLTESMPLIIDGMKETGVPRIITIGTAGILQSREYPGLLRYETPDTRRSSTRAAEEHRKAWELLAASGLAWTVICPTYLPDGEPQGGYRAEKDYLPDGGMSISVGDTAAFTYAEALQQDYVNCRVGLAY
ncbi:NAD(P)-dependent oxidoreductase [Paenibacillus aestuarii]|uniref:SDR family oxidoreductase n=1 Tax=Paenibacillus aestuarii TaxID=516965 RepID=A0ABW0KCK3_9BACL|nr:SDR family oxidoreductase [Paenibacillus aestuarii]